MPLGCPGFRHPFLLITPLSCFTYVVHFIFLITMGGKYDDLLALTSRVPHMPSGRQCLETSETSPSLESSMERPTDAYVLLAPPTALQWHWITLLDHLKVFFSLKSFLFPFETQYLPQLPYLGLCLRSMDPAYPSLLHIFSNSENTFVSVTSSSRNWCY